MKKCIVLYENWQMECCGTPFANQDNIKWLVCNGDKIKLPVETEKIDYLYEAHSSDYEKMWVLEGKVNKIKALYQKYSKSSEDSNLSVPVDGVLVYINASEEIKTDIDNMEFSSYIVYLENYTIRDAEKNDVTFR